MKKFAFRYESILNKYQADEDNVRNELYSAQKLLYKLMEDKKTIVAEKVEFDNSFSNSLSDGIAVSEYKLYENAKYHYRQNIEKLDMLITNAELELTRLKNAVVEAMKKRKMMESLKEKEYNVYLENINVAENKLIEEIVNYQSYQKGDRS